MISGAAFFAVSATSAYAADAPSDNVTTTSELVVTGSRIPQPNLTSISPVTAINSEEIKISGATRVEDLINNLPQAFADQGSNLSNGAVGTATVNLRNLGPSRTLVLVDGKRLVPGDPAYPYADLNFIPSSLVERVEVDTGGASAVYGADAVAGVVNFIMNRNFEGVRLDSNYTFYNHHNDNAVAQDALSRKGFAAPPNDVTDGKTWDFSAVVGVNAPDGKGNATAYLTYRHTDALLQSQRDYSACSMALNGAKTGFNCSGSFTSAAGSFFILDDNGVTTSNGSKTVSTTPGGAFRPLTGSDVFNFAPFNYYQRPDERYSGGVFAHYEVTPKIDVYTDFMFMDDHTVAQIAPSGVFGLTVNVPCNGDNPLISASELNDICAVQGKLVDPASTDTANVVVLRRNVEGGNRQDDLRHTDYRLVIGAKGDINANWHYDVYGQYSTAIYAEEYLNDFSLNKLANALDVVGSAANPVCRSGAPGCVPYNIWKPGGVTPQAINYLRTPGFKEGNTTEQVVSGSLTGALGDYGVKSPWATDGVGIALGSEYRRESLDLRVDEEFATGDLAGQGGATLQNSGSFDVWELFGEARVPIVQDATFFKELSVEGGYRYSKYHIGGTSNGFSTNTYKLGVNWSPVSDFRIRASYNRAVRAPNVVELFTPQSVQLDFNTDPCAGASPSLSAAQCANTGVSAAQYGRVPANPANQYNGLTGGNPLLHPETSDTYSVGVVFTPTFIPGFNASVDWYKITVGDVIQGPGSQNVIDTCARTGNPLLCGLIHRAPGNGNLWVGTTGFVQNTVVNLGQLAVSGVDINANYRLPLSDFGMDNWGSLNFQLQGSWTDYYKISTPFSASSCVGFYGQTCQGTGTPMTAPTPKWRHKFRTTWNTPVEGLQVSAAWRYLGDVRVDKTAAANQAAPDGHLGSKNYFDLTGSWRIKDAYTFRVGINNIFDKDPPIVGSGELPSVVGSGNTYPQFYDALGRYVFLGVTADF